MATEKRMFLEALRKKFKESPEEKYTKFYIYDGWKQSKRKQEFVEWGAKLAKERGIPFYNPDMHLGGIPLGQRVLMPYKLSQTDIYCEGDDLHFINNAAMQQMWHDIRRTVIVGLDAAHMVLQKRLGKEVTPETVNHYLEVLNHALPGAAVIQEHMVETHPGLVSDSYVKVFTGDDELADEIDKRFLIDINKEFPADQAAQLKAAVGKRIYQVLRMPTIVAMTCDGGTMSRWSAMQISMSMVNAYKLMAGEAAIGEFAFAAKHAEVIEMGTLMPWRRARGPNEPGGVPLGYLADMCQASRVKPEDPTWVALEAISMGAVLYDQFWFGSYMSGGVGFTQYATCTYTDNILDDFCYYGADYVKKKYGGFGKAKPSWDLIKDVATEVTLYGLEQYERFPALMETHFGGSQRAAVVAAGAGVAVSLATGNCTAGINGWYMSQLLHKEEMGRLGFYGYDQQDQCGSANSFSYRSDEGLPFNLRGVNYPNYALNVGHQSAHTGIVQAAHSGRGDAWTTNPLIKIAFADKDLKFDFTHPRLCFGKGALREFMPAGERSLIIPSH
ncbi:MAG: Methyl coenzyme M reductase alpha subunit [Candidatus Methanosuratincola subterraneus]|uniref:Methyl-coenzyme M reductase subunit alpha n=1 Tax=Methanosuratincola subterraneus TaxID=2593994 RepID=A0A444L8F5_METS7|nr:MAG: Methyl coenzyme M reductase alpha subunit [Candidatus Methanosuratincola subterraneus]